MRRRTILAAVPAAALLPSLGFAQNSRPAASSAPGGSPPRWEAGEERFVRPDIQGGDRPVGASFASRTAVYGLNGAAGTSHPLATQAGIDILKRGGSAVDAAIAINACLGFLEPTANGIGGDVYAMIWDPKQRKVVGTRRIGPKPARARPRHGAVARQGRGPAILWRGHRLGPRHGRRAGGRCTSATAGCPGPNCSSRRSPMPKPARRCPT